MLLPVSTLQPPPSPSEELATRILREVMQHRRAHGAAPCDPGCPACLAPHLEKVRDAIAQGRPIDFVLPAFPGKSPNPAKVLGHLPDLGERRALTFLHQLCLRIGELHAPGARMILCSDGRVFSDAVGMREEHVSAYQQEISNLIRDLGLTTISTFNLDDVYHGASFAEMRAHLMQSHGASLESLQAKVRRGADEEAEPEAAEAHRMYLGITRFLVEDATHPGETRSRTAIQKECKQRAYEVIRRSNAWSQLIADRFPGAVRLSIHPQTCGARKLGIKLVDAESWMTPWHGVAVEIGGKFLLLKRAQAEALGARVVHSAGRPSHFEMTERRLAHRGEAAAR